MAVSISALVELKKEINELRRKISYELENLDVSHRQRFNQKIEKWRIKSDLRQLHPRLRAQNNVKEAERRSQNNLRNNECRAEWFCPLSGSLMVDPVIALDGRTYDRAYITQFLREPHPELDPESAWAFEKNLVPNVELYHQIEPVLKPKLMQQKKELENLLNELRALKMISDPAYKGEEENRNRKRDPISILPLPPEFSALRGIQFPPIKSNDSLAPPPLKSVSRASSLSLERGALAMQGPDQKNNSLLAEEAREWRGPSPRRVSRSHMNMALSSPERLPNSGSSKGKEKEEEDIPALPLFPEVSAASSSAMVPPASKSFFSTRMPNSLKPKKEEEKDIPVLSPYPNVSVSSFRGMAPDISSSSSSSSVMASRANISSIFSSLYRQNDEQGAVLSPSPSSIPLPSEVERYLALKTLYDKLNALLLARDLNSLKYGKLIGNIVSLSGKISAEMQKYGGIDVPPSTPIDIEQVIPQYQNVEKAMQNCLQKLKARYPDATYTHIYTPTYKFSFIFGTFESEAFSPQRMKDVPQSVDSSFFSGFRKDDRKRLQEEIDSLGIPGTVDSSILHSYVSDCATIKGVRVIFECDNAKVWNIAAAIEDIHQEFLGTLDQGPVPVQGFFR